MLSHPNIRIPAQGKYYSVNEGNTDGFSDGYREFLRRNNTEYSQRLAEWAVANGAYFAYASSAAVYGDGSLGFSDADALTPKLKPLNPYGRSKLDFDVWADDEVRARRLARQLVGADVVLGKHHVDDAARHQPHDDEDNQAGEEKRRNKRQQSPCQICLHEPCPALVLAGKTGPRLE